jgi:hypothetical protein
MGTPSGMPIMKVAKLRYCEETGFTSTSGAFSTHVYKANDVYDPDYSGGGHQPMGFDQWALLYNHYIVLGSRMRVYLHASDSNTDSMTCGIYLDDDQTLSYNTIPALIEARKGSFAQVGLPAGGNVGKKLTGKFSTKKYFNITNVKDNLDRLGANVASSPSETASYHLWYQTADQVTTASLRAVVIIDYIVLFSEPKSLAQS